MAESQSTRVNSALAVETLSGTIGGRFLIGERLGKGGMGEVYRAEDTKLKRSVALKRLGPHLRSDTAYRLRFLEEAERASRLSDSHVAAVHDVLEERGEIFLVMEYVEGENLRNRLRRHISLEQFFEVAMQCAEALVAAHESGIVHCDIKPENIMLTTKSQVKMLDFGVAKYLPRSDQSSTADRAGTMAGTPAYMSPEVLLEKFPDERADIFSLGVVLYEMLSGHHPFLAGSFVATSDRIRHETPTPIHIFNSKVPEELEKLISKALAKEPGQRHASARELLQDLRVVQASVTPLKLSRVLPRRAKRPRKRWLAAGIVVAAVAAAVSGIYSWHHRSPILTQRGWVLISDFDTSGDETIPDKGVREGLIIALQQSRYVNVYPRTQALEVLQRMKKENVQRIDEALGREICQRENLRVLLTGSIEHLGQVFQITVRALDPAHGTLLFAERERFDRKEDFFDKADVLAKRVRNDLGESLLGIEKTSRPLAKVTTRSLEALQFYSQAKDAEDQGNDTQVEGLLKAALLLDPDFAMAHLQLGQHYSMIGGKNERTVVELEDAYRLRQGVTEREQRRIEAGYYSMREQYEDEAQSLSILVGLYPDDQEAHQDLAGAYYDIGQLDKAILELREVLRLNPSSALAYRSLVLYLARSGQAETAIAVSREALQRAVDPPQMHWGVGLAYLIQGNVSMARQEFQEIGQGTGADRELRDLNLVDADLYEGKLNAAKDRLVKQIQAMPQRSGGLQTVRRYLLGRILLNQGSSREAKLEADLILQVPSTGLQVYDLLNAGILYARAGRIDQARQVLRQLDHSRQSVPTSWNRSCFHNLEGEIGLAAAKPQQAESSFATAAEEYPQAFSHAGLARAYQTQKRWDLAAREWEEVLHRKGEVLQSDFGAPDLLFAHLQLARVYREMNHRDLARSHYEEVLRMWQYADALPLVTDAKRELRELMLELSPRETTQIIAPQASSQTLN